MLNVAEREIILTFLSFVILVIGVQFKIQFIDVHATSKGMMRWLKRISQCIRRDVDWLVTRSNILTSVFCCCYFQVKYVPVTALHDVAHFGWKLCQVLLWIFKCKRFLLLDWIFILLKKKTLFYETVHFRLQKNALWRMEW